MTPYHAGAPMERVHLDFMGPLPKTKKGNEYVLMMVDQFTKWTECIPLPSQTAEITAQAAINEFFARFGYPFQIFTDQGRNFESALFKAVCDLLQIHKVRTTPYRPSTIMSTYSLPFFVFGKGPIKSRCTRSIGAPA
jgi:transposase InsO family protein